MKRQIWQMTGRVTAGVVATSLAVCALWFSGEPTSDDEGMWLRDTPTTTTITTTQMQDILRTPLARQVLDIGNAVLEQRPTQTIGQRAVGLEGPIGAEVSDIHATATLSPGARIEKGLSGFDPWPNIDAAAHFVTMVCVLLVGGLLIGMFGVVAVGRARR